MATIQLLAVQAHGICCHWVNTCFTDEDLAENNEGDSSSNDGGGDPDDITDPDFVPDNDDGNCFISEEEMYPWWSVDLGSTEQIGRVEVSAGAIDGKQIICGLFD